MRLQQRSQRRDRRFPGGGAESPPRTPPHGSRYGTPRFPGTSGNHFLGRRRAEPLFSPSHCPSSHLDPAPSPQTSPLQLPYAPGAKTRLPGCAGSQYAGAQRRRGRLRSKPKLLGKGKQGEDCTCAGRLGHNWLRPTVKMATGTAHAHTPNRFSPKGGSTAGPGGGQTLRTN